MKYEYTTRIIIAYIVFNTSTIIIILIIICADTFHNNVSLLDYR